MVCFHTNTGFSRPEGGKGYIGLVISLHMHGIADIAGLQRNILEYIRGCNYPETGEHFKERFRKFVDSVVTCSLPVSVGEQEPLLCLNCGPLNSIEPMKELPQRLTGHFRDMQIPLPHHIFLLYCFAWRCAIAAGKK